MIVGADNKMLFYCLGFIGEIGLEINVVILLKEIYFHPTKNFQIIEHHDVNYTNIHNFVIKMACILSRLR